jgi:hypothetical protein
MLLKRTEKDGVVSALYDSSNILGSKWNGKNLTVIFRHGASYTYNDVSKTDYMRFETADSQGVVLNAKIKAYSFQKDDAVDSQQLINEVNQAKTDTLTKFEEGLVDEMRLLVSAYEVTPTLTKQSIERLAEMLVKHGELGGAASLKLCACD